MAIGFNWLFSRLFSIKVLLSSFVFLRIFLYCDNAIFFFLVHLFWARHWRLQLSFKSLSCGDDLACEGQWTRLLMLRGDPKSNGGGRPFVFALRRE